MKVVKNTEKEKGLIVTHFIHTCINLQQASLSFYNCLTCSFPLQKISFMTKMVQVNPFFPSSGLEQ